MCQETQAALCRLLMRRGESQLLLISMGGWIKAWARMIAVQSLSDRPAVCTYAILSLLRALLPGEAPCDRSEFDGSSSGGNIPTSHQPLRGPANPLSCGTAKRSPSDCVRFLPGRLGGSQFQPWPGATPKRAIDCAEHQSLKRPFAVGTAQAQLPGGAARPVPDVGHAVRAVLHGAPVPARARGLRGERPVAATGCVVDRMCVYVIVLRFTSNQALPLHQLSRQQVGHAQPCLQL